MEAADSGLEHVRLLTTAPADGGGELRLYGHAQGPDYYFERHQFYLLQSSADVLKTRIRKAILEVTWQPMVLLLQVGGLQTHEIRWDLERAHTS
jgi:hypothetical protein